MQNEQRTGLSYSAALHFVLLLLMVFGLPSFMQSDIAPQPMVVAVDILPISEITNVKPSDLPLAKEEKPQPVQDEKMPTPPVKSEPPAEQKPEPKPEPKPEEKIPDKPKEKEPEKKPEPKKEEKPKKAKEEDLEAVLKSLREKSEKDKKADEKKDEKPKEEAGTKVKGKNTQYDERLPMSMTELDAIRSQIAKCWNVPAGAKDAHELRVTIRVQLAQDGSVILVELASESKGRYAADSFYRAAADSAMRAVRQCSPLKNLSPEKYNTWRDMEMTFDPKEMLY